MITATQKRTIDPDVYDTLELSALAHGGIGGGDYHDPEDHEAPYCVVGHVRAATAVYDAHGNEVHPAVVDYRFVLDELSAAFGFGGVTSANDNLVARVNAWKGRPARARISFEEYVAAAGWERGE